MDQPRRSHRLATGPSAAANQQARLTLLNLQQSAFLGFGEDRLHHVLALGQWRDLRKVRIGRLLGEVLLEVVRGDLGIDVAIFDLHRHAVLVVHDQRMEHPLAFAHVQARARSEPAVSSARRMTWQLC